MLIKKSKELFFGVLIFSFLAGRFFQNYLLRFSKEILYDFMLSVLERLRSASLQAFKKLGRQRIYTAINDTRVVADLPRFFVEASNQTVMVICGLVYLFWKAPLAMLLTVGVAGILIAIYWFRNEAIMRDLNVLRDKEDEFYRLLEDLLGGFRELKMSISRNDNLYHHFLKKNRDAVKDLDIDTSIKYLDNNLLANYGWFLVLGAVIFLLPLYQEIDMAQRTTFVIVILYLMIPISFVINSFDFITRFQIAQSRLVEFDQSLTDISMEASTVAKVERGDWLIDRVEEIRFEEVCYTYSQGEEERRFTLGPVDLTIRRGETVFVVGENGSGKSTFMMLLAGLFAPSSGRISVNGVAIGRENGRQYRNLLSSIFTDAHLFSEHYDDYDIHNAYETWEDLVELMRLKGIVAVDNLKKVANPNLSKGQQKRLLMMYTLLEDKDVILLDEWAAEQDPSFRAIFYRELLPHLKARGKTIIAITHDDRYFDQADRLITFYDGQLEVDGPRPMGEELLDLEEAG